MVAWTVQNKGQYSYNDKQWLMTPSTLFSVADKTTHMQYEMLNIEYVL